MYQEEVGPDSIYNLQRYGITFYALDTSRYRHSGIQCLLATGSCLQDSLGQLPLWSQLADDS